MVPELPHLVKVVRAADPPSQVDEAGMVAVPYSDNFGVQTKHQLPSLWPPVHPWHPAVVEAAVDQSPSESDQ